MHQLGAVLVAKQLFNGPPSTEPPQAPAQLEAQRAALHSPQGAKEPVGGILFKSMLLPT